MNPFVRDQMLGQQDPTEPGLDILIVGDQEEPPFVNDLKENIPGLKVSFSGVTSSLETLATDASASKTDPVLVHDLSNKTEEDAVMTQSINDAINNPDNSLAYLPGVSEDDEAGHDETSRAWVTDFTQQYEAHGGTVVTSTEALIDKLKSFQQ